MKFGIAFVLMWIHVIALTSLASVTGETLKWPPWITLGVWIICAVCGIFPIIRTIAMLILALLLLPWWKAIIFTMIASAVLLVLEGFGTGMMKARRQLKTVWVKPSKTLADYDHLLK